MCVATPTSPPSPIPRVITNQAPAPYIFPPAMPPSEIDAIFASKGKASLSSPPNHPLPSSPLPDKKKKKKKKKEKEQHKAKETSTKRKRDDDDDGAEATPSKTAKRHVPETVFDTSASLPLPKKTKYAKPDKIVSSVTKVKKPKKDREEEERFKDSRGTGPRMSPVYPSLLHDH